MNNYRHLFLIIILSSFLGGSTSIIGYKYFINDKKYESIESSQKAHFTNYLADTNFVVPEALNFIHAADVVTPAVVHIRTYYEAKKTSQQQQKSPFDDMLRDYFGDQFGLPNEMYNQGRP